MPHSHRKRRKARAMAAAAAASAAASVTEASDHPDFVHDLWAWRYGTNRKWQSEQGCTLTLQAGLLQVTKNSRLLQSMALPDVAYGVDYIAAGRMILVSRHHNGYSLFVCLNGQSGVMLRNDLIAKGVTLTQVGYRDFYKVQKDLSFPLCPVEPLPKDAAPQPPGPLPPSSLHSAEDLRMQLESLQSLNRGMEVLVTSLHTPIPPALDNPTDTDTKASQESPSAESEAKYSVLHEDGDFDFEVPAHLIRLCRNRPPDWGKGKLRGYNLVPEGSSPPGTGLYIGAPVVARWQPYHFDPDISGTDDDAWFAGTIVMAPPDLMLQKRRLAPGKALYHQTIGGLINMHPAVKGLPVSPQQPPPQPPQPRNPTSGWSPTSESSPPLIFVQNPHLPPSSTPARQPEAPKVEDAADTHWVVLHEDGDLDEDVPSSRIRLCENRPPEWGKGGFRGIHVLPPGCGEPGVGLYVGAKVVAQWTRYRGCRDDAWFAGTILSTAGGLPLKAPADCTSG
eukprot:Sspe_Gene.51190::Locus_28430_Transcript_1_1_Confidence_1.000_Length_1650::g.51190::m.51190